MTEPFLVAAGQCPICEQQVTFESQYAWLRDHLFCSNCKSIPRERALMEVIRSRYPHYRELTIHESSPGGGGTSAKLKRECPGYSESQFYPRVRLGTRHPLSRVRCEDIQHLQYDDGQFDLFITQDVMEHVLSPERAFREIARVLKPGGAHIFTVPLVNKERPSKLRARSLENGEIEYLAEPNYHGNPISSEGSLVTMDWGYDICDYILEQSGLHSTLIYLDDLSKGIRAEFIEVVCTQRPGVA